MPRKSETNGKHQATVIDVPVKFGGVSIGQATARLGVAIDRSALDLETADQCFCGKRLTGQVVLGRRDEAPGQSKMWESDHAVSGSFDVKKISVSPDIISTGLTFNLATIDIAELAKLSKGAGKLLVYEVTDLPEDAADEHDKDEFDSGTPSTLKASGPWRDVPLDSIFGGGILKALKQRGLETVGALSDYTASEKRLTDIEGIGPGKAQNIEEKMLIFWRDNPQYCDGKDGTTEGERQAEEAVNSSKKPVAIGADE